METHHSVHHVRVFNPNLSKYISNIITESGVAKHHHINISIAYDLRQSEFWH